jgi:hypothetical protein
MSKGMPSDVVPTNAGTRTPCPIVLHDRAETFRSNTHQGLWVPAFAGTTRR